MTSVTAVLRCFLTFTLLLVTSVQLPHSQPDGCSAVLVAFSPCLSYVSSPPNDLAQTASSQCCDTVNSAFGSGQGECLCEPVGQPLIFGFPLNETRLLSLSSVCHTSGSLESICSSGSSPLYSEKLPELPPVSIPKPPDSGEQPHLPIRKPPDSGDQPHLPIPKPPEQPHLPIPKPPDSGEQPHLPIPETPDSGEQPHSPIPKPPDSGEQPHLPVLNPPSSGEQPHLPVINPPSSGDQPHLPIPNPPATGKQPQLPLPPLPFPKPSDSGNRPQLPFPKPSNSGTLAPLPLPPLGGTTGPEIPNPFAPGHGNTSTPSQSLPLISPPAQAGTSPATPSSSSSAQVSESSFPAKQILESSSWFLPGILISLVVFVHV